MPNVLKNIVSFVLIAPGAVAVQAHGLKLNGVGLIPDELSLATDGEFSVDADETDVTVKNVGAIAASIDVLVEHWHSIPRALPPPLANLLPQPFIPSGSPAGSAPLDWKKSCRVATDIPLVVLSGLLTVDGVVLAADDRVLVKNQLLAATNGIYTAAAGAWARAIDANISAEVTSGLATNISEGSMQKGSTWVLRTTDPIILGTTLLTFMPFLSAPHFSITAIKTAAFTAQIGQLARCNPTAGGFTVALPALNLINQGGALVIKNSSGSPNVITIAPAGGNTIDGAASATIAVARGSLTLVSNGVAGGNWEII